MSRPSAPPTANMPEYAYMLKFAVLRSNEEYYVMRDAKWGDKHEEEQGQHEG